MELAGYRNLGLLASGGACLVYEAESVLNGRRVAVKTPRPEILASAPTFGQVIQEGRVLAQFSHPNVALLIDQREDIEGRPCLVLERVEGETLRTLRDRKTRLRIEVVCVIGLQLLRALAHVHQRGFVHRDVQPDNILVSREGAVKLIDFGAAMELTAATSANARPAVFGTPAYMAPEQNLGEASLPASDLFSVGVVLYELACGRKPWGETSSGRARTEAASPLRSRAPDVPHAFEAFIMRLLQKRSDDRFATAKAALEALSPLFRDLDAGNEEELLAGLFAEKKKLPEGARPAKRSALHGALPFAAVGGLFLLLSLVLRAITSGASMPVSGAPLPLVPDNAAFVRVLATPWAEVWVDGQLVETTPFAKPIPVSAGVHYVTLKHPSAESIERKIDPKKNETVTLDVTFDVATDGGYDIVIDAGSDVEAVLEEGQPRVKAAR